MEDQCAIFFKPINLASLTEQQGHKTDDTYLGEDSQASPKTREELPLNIVHLDIYFLTFAG